MVITKQRQCNQTQVIVPYAAHEWQNYMGGENMENEFRNLTTMLATAVIAVQYKQEGAEHAALMCSVVKHKEGGGVMSYPNSLGSICEGAWKLIAAF